MDAHRTFFTLLDEDVLADRGPTGSPLLSEEPAVDLHPPLDPNGSALTVTDELVPALSSRLEPLIRGRSNTWHGQARRINAIQSSIVGNASVEDSEEDEDDDDVNDRKTSRSTSSTSVVGDVTMECTDPSESNGFDITAPDVVSLSAPMSTSEAVTSSASAVASSPKSTSRRNAWGSLSYADLITKAIQSSPEHRLTLSQIYAWMVANVPFFKDKGENNSSAGWKNSIRHNLSLHNRFMRVQNEGTGKSSWWMMNPQAAQTNKLPRRPRALTLDTKSYERQRRRAAVISSSPASSIASDLHQQQTLMLLDDRSVLSQRHRTSRSHPLGSSSSDEQHLQHPLLYKGCSEFTAVLHHEPVPSSTEERRIREGGYLGGCALSMSISRTSPIETIHESDVIMADDVDHGDHRRYSVPTSSSSSALQQMFVDDCNQDTLSETMADMFPSTTTMTAIDEVTSSSSLSPSSRQNPGDKDRTNYRDCRCLVGTPTKSSMAMAPVGSRSSNDQKYFRSQQSYDGLLASSQTTSRLSAMLIGEGVDTKPPTWVKLEHYGATNGYLNDGIECNESKSAESMEDLTPSAVRLMSCMYGSPEARHSQQPGVCSLSYSIAVDERNILNTATNDGSGGGHLPSAPITEAIWPTTDKFPPRNWSHHPLRQYHHQYEISAQQSRQCQPSAMAAMETKPLTAQAAPPLRHFAYNGVDRLTNYSGKVNQVAIARLLVERPHLMEKMQQLIQVKRQQLCAQLQEHQHSYRVDQQLHHQLHHSRVAALPINEDCRRYPQEMLTPTYGDVTSSSNCSYPTSSGVLDADLLSTSSPSFFPTDIDLDLDLDLTAGDFGAADMDMYCDIDQVIEHELALDGKLEFMFDCLAGVSTPVPAATSCEAAAIYGGN